MSNSHPVFIGVDLGGTNIEAAAVRGGQVLKSEKKKTQPRGGVRAVVDRIETTVRKVIEKMAAEPSDFEAVCIGAPGAVDTAAGLVRDAPNLGWKNVPLGAQLQDRLGLPVLVDNDVNIGVVGEHAYGAGRGSLHMVGVFVGTGVGGGIVIDGKLHYGSRGAAAEIGHMVVHPRGRRCGCGREGCVEAYTSKTAMERMIREQVEKGRKSVVPKLIRDKGRNRLTSSVVAEALENNDPVMKEVLETAQYYLGVLTANLVNTLDPEVIVFGGGLVERLGAAFVEPVAHIARKHYLQQENAELIRVVPAELGDHAGPVGAAVVAQRRLAKEEIAHSH